MKNNEFIDPTKVPVKETEELVSYTVTKSSEPRCLDLIKITVSEGVVVKEIIKTDLKFVVMANIQKLLLQEAIEK